MFVTADHRPVVLVHGWKSHPGIWDPLVEALTGRSIPCWLFDHSWMRGTGLDMIAGSFQDFMRRKRDATGFSGPVDIICHSMGTGIARFLLEVIDGREQEERVGQLIALGPPNNGSSLAELFFNPSVSPRILRVLGGVFVPRRFNPPDDIIVTQFRPGSRVMGMLRSAGIREDLSYRMILTENRDTNPAFFPPFRGKTLVASRDGWETTYAGDGIVPHVDSFLPGAGYDILPADPVSLRRSPDLYCHLHLPRNPEVIQRIVEYICDPGARPHTRCPAD